MPFISTFRTLIFWTIFLLSSIILSLLYPILPTIPYTRLLRFCTRICLFLSGVRVRVEGEFPVDIKKNYIIVCNYSSFIDHIVLLAKLPIDFRFVAHYSGFKVPLIKNIYAGARFVGVGYKGSQMLSSAARLISELKKGDNLVFYSRLGKFEFNEGIVKLSNNLDIDILPIYIKNSSKVMPTKKIIIKGLNPICLNIGEIGRFETSREIDASFVQVNAIG